MTKKLITQDVSKKSVKEIVIMRTDLMKQLFDAKMKNAVKGLKQTHLIKSFRKNIARLNTFLSSKLKATHGDHMNKKS